VLLDVNEVGRFDISGSVIIVGPKMQDALTNDFLTVFQKDGSSKAVDRL
jgi:branched-chain amino acid transport system substrate-binding protein